MAVSRILARGWIGLATALLLAPAAGALSVTGLSVTTTGTDTANSSSTNGNNNTQVASSTSVVLAPGGPVSDTIGNSISFQTNYAWLVTADRDNNGNGGLITSATAAYQIVFTVDNPGGATYQLDIDTLRVGSLTIVDDSTGNASIQLDAVSGSVDAVTNAALALATIGPVAGTTSFSQSGSTLSITSSDLSHVYTLAFTWTGTSTSNNDEASIRMGIPGTVGGVTADDYPGVDSRTASSDGHFVTVTSTIIAAPEPAPAALIALGLVALALRGRRNR